MSETDKVVAAVNRLAQAIERLADAYLDVNLPDDPDNVPEWLSLSEPRR